MIDVADILSHTPEGVACIDLTSRLPNICQAYAADWNQGGGHLTPLAQQRMAKAVWLMMVRLSQ